MQKKCLLVDSSAESESKKDYHQTTLLLKHPYFYYHILQLRLWFQNKKNIDLLGF